jgi:hypothetical protein
MNKPLRRSDRQHTIRLPDGEGFQLRYVIEVRLDFAEYDARVEAELSAS